MKKISQSELASILTRDKRRRVKFALEIENTNGGKDRIFSFKEAFSPGLRQSSTEFMAVFADTEEYGAELNVSINAISPEFSEECAGKLREITNGGKTSEVKITIHTENTADYSVINNFGGFSLPTGEFRRSFYCDTDIIDMDILSMNASGNITARMLGADDEALRGAFEDDPEDDYLSAIFGYSICRPKYKDCGIVGGFDADGRFVGYLSYYGLDESMRDVSYIYVGKNYRRRGYGWSLLNFFKKKNIIEDKISYYSYPENKYSERLAEKCGFMPCAHRYEYII